MHRDAVLDDQPTPDDGVPRRHRTAPQPRLDRVRQRARRTATPSSGQTTRSPHAPTDSSPISPVRPRQAAPPRVAISRASRADIEPGAVPQLALQHRRPGLQPQRGRVRRRRTVAPQPDRRAGRPQLGHRRQPAAQDHVRRRAVRGPTRGGAEPDHLVGRGPDDVRQPRPGRSSSRRRRGSRPGGGRTAPGRTRPRPASRTGGCAAGRRAARPARRCGVISDVETLNGEHGASAIRVIAAGERSWWRVDQPLRLGQDLVVVLDDRVRRQAAVLHRQRHRAAGRVEPHAQVAGRGDLGGDQVAGTARVDVEVVGGGGAAAQGQLGQPDVGADVRRLLVQPGPQRVERDQPVEQPAGQRRREGPGQVLVQVVMGVDQARRDQAAAGVDRAGGVGGGSAGPPIALIAPSVTATQPPGISRRASSTVATSSAPVISRSARAGFSTPCILPSADAPCRGGRAGGQPAGASRPPRRRSSRCRPRPTSP